MWTRSSWPAPNAQASAAREDTMSKQKFSKMIRQTIHRTKYLLRIMCVIVFGMESFCRFCWNTFSVFAVLCIPCALSFMPKIKLRAQIFIEWNLCLVLNATQKYVLNVDVAAKKCERSTKIPTEISTSHKSSWNEAFSLFFVAVVEHYSTLFYLYPLISNIMLILVMNFWFSTSRNCRSVKLKWFAFTFLRNSHENCHD